MQVKTRKIHLVGIGGIGMSGIAEVLKNMGYEVSGSDIKRTPITERLESIGIKISYVHSPQNVEGKDLVVVSSAIRADNPEVRRAEELRIPVMHRTDMLADLMRAKYSIAVTGSHGKTTTASLIGEILGVAGFDPTLIIGGKLKSIGTNARLGESEYLVAEVDESDGTFVKIGAIISVLTNVDREHLNKYESYNSLIESLSAFMNKVPFWGVNIICIEDAGARKVLSRLRKRVIRYGFSHQADVRAEDVSFNGEGYTFSVKMGEKTVERFYIPMPGRHNVLNSLGAICVGIELGISSAEMKSALQSFSGIERRLELKGVREGVYYYDDYGHHPAEIINTLSALREKYPRASIHVIFQPHRYSRTEMLMEEFAQCFYEADTVIVVDVYPAGEDPIPGVSADVLVEKLRKFGHSGVFYGENQQRVLEILADKVKSGDVVLTLGAGDIHKYHEVLKDGF